jgi:hypothetical protein
MVLDKSLALDRCPHCNVAHPFLPVKYEFTTKDSNGANTRCWRFYVCSLCGGVVTAWAPKPGNSVRELFPGATSVDENIPDKAREFLRQAIHSLHAPAGAVMLTASAVDAMLKEKGYNDGHLYPRINKAVDDHLITKEMAQWAHEVRLDANDQRHADTAASLPKESDARKCIAFASALAQFLFVLPAQVKRGIECAKDAKNQTSNKSSEATP